MVSLIFSFHYTPDFI